MKRNNVRIINSYRLSGRVHLVNPFAIYEACEVILLDYFLYWYYLSTGLQNNVSTVSAS